MKRRLNISVLKNKHEIKTTLRIQIQILLILIFPLHRYFLNLEKTVKEL